MLQRCGLIVLFCALVAPEHSTAQQVIHECEHCRSIGLERVLTLGSPSDPELLNEASTAVFVPAIGFVVTSPVSPGKILIFGTDGSFTKSLGREGRGPGEFTDPRVIEGPGDTAWVVDPANVRITSVEPPGSLGSSSRLGGTLGEGIDLGDGRVLASGFVASRGEETLNRPLHVLTVDAKVEASFGAWPDTDYRIHPAIAQSRSGTIWAAPPNRYTLTEWSMDGRVLRTLVRKADWFREWTAVHPSNSVVSEMSVDSQDRIWVVTRLARTDTLPAMNLEAYDESYDTVIEVIDPTAVEVVARRLLDTTFFDFMSGTDLMVRPRQTSEGYILLDLFHPTLQ